MGSGGNIFPIWPANYFAEPPAELGPYGFTEFRVDVPDGADGSPAGITVIAPVGAEGPRPVLLWILGSNVQAYYHQSLHENMASWGYAVIISDGRPLTFTDFSYHDRTIRLALQALEMGLSGELGVSIDEQRIAAGGYSIGATMAIFAAARDARIDAVVAWAPTTSPFWTGVNPEELYPQVTQPAYFLLAELDHVQPIDGFPREIQGKMTGSEITEYVIPQGLHLYFQQPTGADSAADPVSTLTRFEQQGIAIERTRTWLDEQFGVELEP
jgi:predicted dienelactone hydrolase